MASNRVAFVGARSYEETDQDIFYGRDDETSDLLQLVNINSFTLLYGRSGLGKTSVLKAGLFPKLRKQGYLPIYLRPSYSNTDRDFVEEIEALFIESANNASLELPPRNLDTSFWEYLHTLNFIDASTDKKIIPVFVFDQFEELFTLGSKEKSSDLRPNSQKLVEFIADLVENTPPQGIPEEQSIELQYKYCSKGNSVKIIFSFREEYLSNFYSLSTSIPSIAYSNLQYRLLPLNYLKAYKIIEHASVHQFNAAEVEAILNVVTESATREEAETRDVDSFILSVYCEHKLRVNQSPKNLTAKTIETYIGIQELIEGLYYKVKLELSLNDAEKLVLEDNLLSPEGYRLPLYTELAFQRKGVRVEKINALCEKKILKKYFLDGKPCIEIMHDKFAGAIKNERDFRIGAERKRLQIEAEEKELIKKREIEEQANREREEFKLQLQRAREAKIQEERKRLEVEKLNALQMEEMLMVKANDLRKTQAIQNARSNIKIYISALFLLITLIIIILYKNVQDSQRNELQQTLTQMKADSLENRLLIIDSTTIKPNEIYRESLQKALAERDLNYDKQLQEYDYRYKNASSEKDKIIFAVEKYQKQIYILEDQNNNYSAQLKSLEKELALLQTTDYYQENNRQKEQISQLQNQLKQNEQKLVALKKLLDTNKIDYSNILNNNRGQQQPTPK